jgi:hypothetical protein
VTALALQYRRLSADALRRGDRASARIYQRQADEAEARVAFIAAPLPPVIRHARQAVPASDNAHADELLETLRQFFGAKTEQQLEAARERARHTG